MPNLFEEFPSIPTTEWMDVVVKDLKGADFDKKLVARTEDGFPVRPFYRSEDVPAFAEDGSLRSAARKSNDWVIREQVREPDIKSAHDHALRALGRGAQEVAFLTYPMGVPVHSQAAMREVLDGIFIEMAPIHWMSGPYSAETLAMYVNEADRRGIARDQLTGSIDMDPILDAASGWVEASIDDWKTAAVPVLRWALKNTPKLKVLTLRGSLIEKAGASAAQEIALVASLLSEYLSGLQAEGFDPAQLVGHLELRFAVGSQYLLEIAKLRAIRPVIAEVLRAYGVEGVFPAIHVDTTSSNKTLYDPYVNLLRATTEAMSAAVAGADSMTVSAFDQGYHTPDEFSEHIARNTETLLKDEAFLTKVVDPLGGSYAIEALTASTADAAWNLFLKLEAEGGFIAAWKSGTIANELERVRTGRAKAANSRRQPIVGTSSTPNLKERRLDDLGDLPKFHVLRSWTTEADDFDGLLKAYADGRTIDHALTDTKLPCTALNAFRPSWPFEHLRLRVERHAAAGGKVPTLFLAVIGDATMRRARANFVTGFYGCGGYAVLESAPNAPIEEAARQAHESHADFLVLCSSDTEYDTLVPSARAALDGLGCTAKLLVAGYPEATLEALKAAGADDFVHLRLDCVATLEATHKALGIPEVTL